MPIRRVHDRALLDVLENLGAGPLSDTAWRATWTTRDPLVGSIAGGRWVPSGYYEALYTSTALDGALAETHYHLSRAPLFSSSSFSVHELEFKTERTLDLTGGENQERVGITASLSATERLSRSQEIGAAAFFLEFDSLVVPSLRYETTNLIFFLERIPAESLRVIRSEPVNWPAWEISKNS